MTRPVRIEYEGAIYHVTSRGNRKEAIYDDDSDRMRFLEILGQVIQTNNWVCHAYCLMTNHYHLVIETPDGNLSKGMRQLNGVYTQSTNRRHARVGHLFQGRYKAILVDGDSYLLELMRYVVLNPVRAGMVEQPGDWPWSSYLAMLGNKDSPSWLATDRLLSHFSIEQTKAIKRYVQFVKEGVGKESIWKDINHQIYLGDEAFVQQMQAKHKEFSETAGVPKAQKRPPAPALEKLISKHNNRNQGIVAAYATGAYSYQQIADFLGLHYTTVGNIVRKARASG